MRALQTMSTNVDMWMRRSAFIMIGIVAGSSAVLSWNGLAYLGQQAEIPYVLSFLLPLSIDGMILLGGTVIIHSTLSNQSTWFGWLMTGLGVVLSIYGNIASVGSHDLQSQIVHAVPPMALFLSLEGLLRIIKHRITTTQALAMAKAQKQARIAEQALLALEATASTVTKVKKPARKSSIAGGAVDNKVVTTAGSRSRVDATDPEVGQYRSVLDTLLAFDSTVSKVGQVEAILREYPDARSVHIAIAMGLDPRTLGTTVSRAKAKLAKDNGTASMGHGLVGSTGGTDTNVAKVGASNSVGVLAMG